MSMTFARSSTYGLTKSTSRVVLARIARANGMRLTSALPARSRALARSWIHEVTSVSAGPPLGGLYLKPPSAGGLCDGVITIPSPLCSVRPAIVDEDGVRDDRRRRHAVVALDDRLDAFGRQDLERRSLGRAGEGVRVLAQEERTVDPALAAVIADRLGDRQDVRLGERVIERRAPVAAGAEGDALRADRRDRAGWCNRLARAPGRRSRHSAGAS